MATHPHPLHPALQQLPALHRVTLLGELALQWLAVLWLAVKADHRHC